VENGKANEMRMRLFQKFMLTAKEIAAQIDLGYEKNKSTSGPNVVESIGLPTLKKNAGILVNGLRKLKDWREKPE